MQVGGLQALLVCNGSRRSSNRPLPPYSACCSVCHSTWARQRCGCCNFRRASRGRSAARHRRRKLDGENRWANPRATWLADRNSCLQRGGRAAPRICGGSLKDGGCSALARGNTSRNSCGLVFPLFTAEAQRGQNRTLNFCRSTRRPFPHFAPRCTGLLLTQCGTT